MQRSSAVTSILAIALVAASRAEAAPGHLIGTYTVNYLYNAGGCSGSSPNPYFCWYIAPGPIHIPAAAGRYRIIRTQVLNPSNDAGGVKIWDGDANSGTQYNPGLGPVELEHASGDITLYYNDWAPFDNDPAIASVVEVYSIDCDVPDGQVATHFGWGSDQPLSATKGEYFLTLQGNADYSERIVQERASQGGQDNCWFPNSFYPPMQLGNRVWTVDVGNTLSPPTDELGQGEDQVTYYRRQRAARGLPVACQIFLYQQMTISCPDGSSQDFGHVNRMIITLGPNFVGVSRDGVYVAKRY